MGAAHILRAAALPMRGGAPGIRFLSYSTRSPLRTLGMTRVSPSHGVVAPMVFRQRLPNTSFVERPSIAHAVRMYATEPGNGKNEESLRKKAERPQLQQLERNVKSLLQRVEWLLAAMSQLQSNRKHRRWALAGLAAALLLGLVLFVPSVRRFALAIKRCSIVGWAVFLCIIDYKILFWKTWPDTEEGRAQRHQDYENCHWRCASRIRDVLLANGGIYIKLGQHLSSIQLIPPAWSRAMKPLQDKCEQTPLHELEKLFVTAAGRPLSAIFSSFDEEPLGVASLAQVHKATDRQTGKEVAVKVMHPGIEEFSKIDIDTTSVMLAVVKFVFPDFEFSWLGDEMRENLPLEMDFRHEAANAQRCKRDFENITTSLVVPDVLWANNHIMVMEFIEGARVDDLKFLAANNIDRNKVSIELADIFARMIYITGFFHADPHAGNLLIRPRQPGSRSPHNFEIVLLDHGLYFDLSQKLRTEYARFWLSLMAPNTPETRTQRMQYAKDFGGISEEMYPVFEAAITGRAAMGRSQKAGSLLEMQAMTPEESKRMRNTMVEEGLIVKIFQILRSVPRRLIMILKVNDLTRSLDNALQTTHNQARVFLVVAQYCNLAVYASDAQDLVRDFAARGLSWRLIKSYFSAFWRYDKVKYTLGFYALSLDVGAKFNKVSLWLKGFWRGGFSGATQAYAGL